MASIKRNNRFARWTVILATGLATVGFWSGIVNGPQPVHNTVASAPTQQTATGSQGITFQQTPAFSSSSGFSSSPQFSPSPPLFRTRGS